MCYPPLLELSLRDKLLDKEESDTEDEEGDGTHVKAGAETHLKNCQLSKDFSKLAQTHLINGEAQYLLNSINVI